MTGHAVRKSCSHSELGSLLCDRLSCVPAGWLLPHLILVGDDVRMHTEVRLRITVYADQRAWNHELFDGELRKLDGLITSL